MDARPSFFFFLAVVCRCRNLLLAPSVPLLPQFVHANTRSVLTHSPPSRGSSSGSSSPPTIHAPFFPPGARQSPWSGTPGLARNCISTNIGQMPASSPDHGSAFKCCSPRWLYLQARASSHCRLPNLKCSGAAARQLPLTNLISFAARRHIYVRHSPHGSIDISGRHSLMTLT